MCDNSFIKISPTTKINMIYCKLLSDNVNDMEQICRFQRYCSDKKEYIFHNEERCKNKKLVDGAYKMQENQ